MCKYFCSGLFMFSLSVASLTFSKGIRTLYGTFTTSPFGELSEIDLSLRKAIFLVEMKRIPAIGPAVVERWHWEAFNNSSPVSTVKDCLNTLSIPPAWRILLPSVNFPLTVSENFGPRLTARIERENFEFS